MAMVLGEFESGLAQQSALLYLLVQTFPHDVAVVAVVETSRVMPAASSFVLKASKTKWLCWNRFWTEFRWQINPHFQNATLAVGFEKQNKYISSRNTMHQMAIEQSADTDMPLGLNIDAQGRNQAQWEQHKACSGDHDGNASSWRIPWCIRGSYGHVVLVSRFIHILHLDLPGIHS